MKILTLDISLQLMIGGSGKKNRITGDIILSSKKNLMLQEHDL